LPSSTTWLRLKGVISTLGDEWDWLIKWAEAEREVIGQRTTGIGTGRGPVAYIADGDNRDLTAPATPDAERWQGWGTALKPAHEPIVVARKPLAGNVAATVLAHGTGALNIDGCRVPHQDAADLAKHNVMVNRLREQGGSLGDSWKNSSDLSNANPVNPAGRWPPNVALDESQAAVLDAMSGERPGAVSNGSKGTTGTSGIYNEGWGEMEQRPGRGDSGGASRFMYVAKADAAERVTLAKVDGEADLFAGSIRKRCTKCGKQEVNMPGSACACPEPDFQPDPSMSGRVSHPTVKPLSLMRWLVRLVTPPMTPDGKPGVVLEPFAGSGTTVEACILEGFRCIAIEREADYLPLIVQRVNRRRDPVAAVRAAGGDGGLFDLLDLFDLDGGAA
jgi:site-specific DNA-methyltransferase (adenine-specific)